MRNGELAAVDSFWSFMRSGRRDTCLVSRTPSGERAPDISRYAALWREDPIRWGKAPKHCS